MDPGGYERAGGDMQPAPELPDFDLVHRIGKGAFGTVWLGVNRTTGQRRAVKVIPLKPEGGADPAGREIVSLTRLESNLRRTHPDLIAIHHVGKTAEHLFYAMDLADDVSGAAPETDASYRPATLESRLAAGPLPPEACLDCARQLLGALAFLHEAGMVHRDVKPANCLFVDGRLKLADFGLLTDARTDVSRLGTERYMPPDGRMDARADVYAAGLVIYEMATGMPAHRFPQLGARARDAAADPVLASLIRTALRACQAEPEARFHDAAAMRAALLAAPDGPPAKAVIRRRALLAGAAALLLLGAAAAVAFWPRAPERVHVNFTTFPFEATILLDGVERRAPGGGACRTPCTIESLPARPHRVAFAREGAEDLHAGVIDFARVREVVARWPQARGEK
ncbi:MAG: serine/threonine protein kinase [Planctomycetes bacterium]|nr:serine/threonine protein kinase [Planctomycetota bacterium]